MGHHVHSCVAPFVVSSFFTGDSSDVESDKRISFLCNPEGIMEGESQWDSSEKFELNGWERTHYESEQHKQFENQMITEHWFKGEHNVFILNESEFNHIGEFDVSIVSKDRESLELFCEDLNVDAKITSNVIVYSWW